MIGNRSLAYFPDEGEDKTRNPQFIEPTFEKEPIKARIIFLDFETYVRDKHIDSGELEPLNEDLLTPSFIDPYEPYYHGERVLNTSQ